MTKKKHKAKAAPATLSDKNYIASGRAHNLPIYKCLINEGWQEDGLADIFVLRKHVNGHVTVGVYLVDIFCAGVKNTFYFFNIPEYEFEDRLGNKPLDLEECSYELAHNIIYGAIAFAQEYGIEPHSDFSLTQKILEEDTEDIELIELEFGQNGMPVLMISPYGDPRADYYLRQLETYAGPGNYQVVDGRLDDSMDEEEEDDFMQPEHWEEEDWDEFIDETEPDKLMDFPEVALYMYDKVAAKPTEAVKMLTSEKQYQSMNITYEPLTDPVYNATPEELQEITSFVFKFQGNSMSTKQLQKLEVRMKNNNERWPDNPVFYSHLISIYEAQDDEDKLDETVETMYAKFPDYLFAKIKYGELLMDRGQVDQVAEVFNNKFDLASLYPDRNTFHVSEFINFSTFMCEYFLKKNDLFTAGIYRDMLLQLDIPESVRFDIIPLIAVDIAMGKEMVEVLKDAKQNEQKKQELIAMLVN